MWGRPLQPAATPRATRPQAGAFETTQVQVLEAEEHGPAATVPEVIEEVPRNEVQAAGATAEVPQDRHEHKKVGVPRVQVRHVPLIQHEEVVREA